MCGMVPAQGSEDKRERIVGPEYGIPMPNVTFGDAIPMPSPKEPNEYKIAKHMLTHLPYCSWCKYSKADRRPNSNHR